MFYKKCTVFFSEVNELLSGLAEAYHSSTSLNLKKGVLLGLAASAIGFGRDARPFLTELLGPILHAAQESDSRLRYFACESLYNVTKAVRTQLIQDWISTFFCTFWYCRKKFENFLKGSFSSSFQCHLDSNFWPRPKCTLWSWVARSATQRFLKSF